MKDLRKIVINRDVLLKIGFKEVITNDNALEVDVIRYKLGGNNVWLINSGFELEIDVLGEVCNLGKHWQTLGELIDLWRILKLKNKLRLYRIINYQEPISFKSRLRDLKRGTISTRLMNCLRSYEYIDGEGIEMLEDLEKVSLSRFKKHRNVGKLSVVEIKGFCEVVGIKMLD